MRPKLPPTTLILKPKPPHHLRPRPSSHHFPLHPRTLTTTPPLLKKPTKHSPPPKRTIPPPSTNAPSQPSDPFDFTTYTAAISLAHTRLKTDLATVKASGPGAADIESYTVILGAPKGAGSKNDSARGTKASRDSVKLGDLASVVARGRNVSVLVGQKEHLKPILSTLASLPSLPYTPSATDPLAITIALPPVTAESRLQAKKDAEKKGEEALFALREARGAQRKRHRRMELGKLAGPDELRRAEKEVERMNEGAVGEARGVVEGWKRGLEGG